MKTTAAAVAQRRDAWVVAAAVPSNVNVFVKALHLLALAWSATVVGVFAAFEPNQPIGLGVILRAALPALALVMVAWSFGQWADRFRGRVSAHAAEWVTALQWNIVPMVFLLCAVAAM
jgi:hypothetical protein